MTKDMNDFYNNFNEENLKGIDVDKKEATYIKKDYWIDILEGINSIIEPYSNYEFTFKE